MIRRLSILMLFACSSVHAQFTPGQILTAQQLNSAFANVLSTSGGTLSGPLTAPALTVTGSAALPDAIITGGSISGLSVPLPVASGGTASNAASGTVLDRITGFSGTGFLTRTGSGTYAFQSTTNGVTLGNLAQIGANSILANSTGSTANVSAFTMPSCSASNSALQYTNGTGFVCGTTFALTGGTLAQFSSTTSAQLAGVISDESGSGSLLFGTNPTVSGATVTGGTINNTPVGATTASTGSFTTLAASSTVSGTGFSTYLASPPAIGGTAPGTGKFTTLQATGAITPSSTAGIVGTTTNDGANAGSIGEYATNNTTSVSLTTATPANCTNTSAPLTAGDWDVQGVIIFTPGASMTVTGLVSGISTTSATFGALGSYVQSNFSTTVSVPQAYATPVTRISIASSSTVYVVGQSSFSGSTLTCSGFIRARRVR